MSLLLKMNHLCRKLRARLTRIIMKFILAILILKV